MVYVTGGITVLVLVLIIRALAFRPYPQEQVQPLAVPVDEQRAVENLRWMVQCRTVSYADASRQDEAEFIRFRQLLATSYPLVHRACELLHQGETGLLYRWPGKSQAEPTVFMAHYDVVPAEPGGWAQPPFAGVIADGCLWGRGTLDTKGTLCAIMEGAEYLIGQGFVPANDIYLAFGGDEEVNGAGAASIVDYLAEQGIRPCLVLDEGGAIVEGAVPGVPGKCALVGTGEKGKLHLRLSHQSKGGHASTPPPQSPVGVLARAVTKIEKKPLKFHLAQPVRQMFDRLGRHAGFALRLVYANLWLFAPLLNLVAKASGGEINALVRTTVAFTRMQASEAVNVFPAEASIEADVRLMEGSTAESVLADLRRRIGKSPIKLEALATIEVKPFSDIDSAAWRRLEQGILAVWPGVKVSPYLMIAASDSRHYTRISDNVFRFAGMELTTAERKMIHGVDERIPLAKIGTTVKFFTGMMLRS